MTTVTRQPEVREPLGGAGGLPVALGVDDEDARPGGGRIEQDLVHRPDVGLVETLEGVGDVEPALAGDGARIRVANGEARRRQVRLRPRRDVDGIGPEAQERRGIDLGTQDDLDTQPADHRLEVAGDPRDLVVERLERREPHLAAQLLLSLVEA